MPVSLILLLLGLCENSLPEGHRLSRSTWEYGKGWLREVVVARNSYIVMSFS